MDKRTMGNISTNSPSKSRGHSQDIFLEHLLTTLSGPFFGQFFGPDLKNPVQGPDLKKKTVQGPFFFNPVQGPDVKTNQVQGPFFLNPVQGPDLKRNGPRTDFF